jgi:hypothetical protein
MMITNGDEEEEGKRNLDEVPLHCFEQEGWVICPLQTNST